jgi:DNA-binding NarL/FixJ family response regulator
MAIEVLLVDDHAILRDGLQMILEDNSDISVIGAATNGIEAIHKIDQLNPEVVIMDISMPKMNGIEATQRIKKNHPEVKILILSMKYSKEDIFQAIKAGAIGYILKESASKEVVRAVRAAHNDRRFLSEKVDELVIDSYIHEQKETAGEHPLELLSSREREILQLITEGKSNKEIAGMLFISEKTVCTYRSRMMKKLDIDNLPELIKFAIRQGITSV